MLEYWEGLQKGDQEAEQGLYEDVFRLGGPVARGRGLDEGSCEAALTKVYDQLQRYARAGNPGPTKNPEAFFKRCVRRVLKDEDNRAWNKRRIESDRVADTRSNEPAPDARIMQHELIDAIRAALELVEPERIRAAWRLKHLEGMSYAKMARVLGATPATLRSHVHQANGKLRPLLRRWEEPE